MIFASMVILAESSTVETAGTVTIVGVLITAFGYAIVLLNRGTDRVDKSAADRVEAAEKAVEAAERRVAEAEARADRQIEQRTAGMRLDLDRALARASEAEAGQQHAEIERDQWRDRYYELLRPDTPDHPAEDDPHAHP